MSLGKVTGPWAACILSALIHQAEAIMIQYCESQYGEIQHCENWVEPKLAERVPAL